MPCNDSLSSSEGVNGASGGEHAPTLQSSYGGANLATVEDSTHQASTCNGDAASHSSHNLEQQQNVNGRIRFLSTRCNANVQSIFNALHPLPDEELESEGWVDMESCRIFLTQYRIIIVAHNQSAICSVPLTGVDLLEAKDIIALQISCKDGKIIKLRAENSEIACTWYKKLIQRTCIPRDLASIFAFKFYFHVIKTRSKLCWLHKERHQPAYEIIKGEFSRFKLGDTWKISTANQNFEICSTYPQYLIIPAPVTDAELKQMRLGRCYHRFPTLVWRCTNNGAVLLRSSQPSIGFFGMANDKDVNMYERIRSAISTDSTMKFLIVDARSYTAAWANRAKGGGFEATDTYANAEVVFMGLPNIHNIRYSFHQLRQLLNSGGDPNNYFQILQSALWLQNIAQLFAATERCLHSLLNEGVSVLVHCSDGWDRTTQIVSLCMLISDPFYRTFEGFKMLVQRQWIEFGHKFADRCGVLNSDDNEKSPVFLQFLDCVYQLWMKNQSQFQFNRKYLMKLVQHTYSGLFGTFIFNSLKEAAEHGGASIDTVGQEKKPQRCFQVWQYLGAENPEFENPAYNKKRRIQVLRCPKLVQELELWRDAYCCTDTQLRINNPDDSSSLQHNSVTGSSQDISSERTNSTLSRSQSAASLQSLEQNASSSVHSSHGGNAFMNSSFPLSNGTTSIASGLSSMKLNEGGPIGGSLSSIDWKRFLDYDGLSKVPTQFEDYIIERDRRELQTRKASPVTGVSTPVRDGLSNGKLVPINGIETTTTRRIRNESVDSSTFEMVNNHSSINGGECCRMKHSSHNSTSSLTSGICLPSSCSSTCTTLSTEFCPHIGFGCKNGVLPEGAENGENDGVAEATRNGN